MNRDDVMRMAHEAGLHIATDHDWMPIIALAYAQKFAELVAAATLKNSVMTDEEYEQAMSDEGQRRMLSFDNDVRALIKEAVEAEREAAIEDARTVGGEAGAEMEKLIRARREQ